MKATERIYRTADGDIVGEGDPRAAFLVAGVGDDVPKEYAAKAREFLGHDDTEQSAGDDSGEKAVDEPANKAARQPANKGKAGKAAAGDDSGE